MSFAGGDLGVLGNLGKALGIFAPDGSPNSAWFENPEASLETMLANEAQREALIAFVDEALGGADRTTEAGVTWLPIVNVDDPAVGVAVTIDESRSDALHIGVGLRFETGTPRSSTTLSIPLFRAHKAGGPSVENPLLLGSPGGRIKIATAITLDSSAPVPGQARLGGIGLEVDVPTSPGDSKGPVFGLSLTGMQLPGAPSPRDVRVVADGAEALDDALLDLVMSLVKAQADAALSSTPIAALGGLLGLKSGDAIPDFPITELPSRGAMAIADWVRGILTQASSRADWLDQLATLLGGSRSGDAVAFDVGGAARLTLTLGVTNGPSGNARLTPSLGVELGNAAARVEIAADVFQIDLVTGEAVALPRLGLWAAAGTSASRILNVTTPTVARADTLRVGFALDAERRLGFVLAADGVRLGAHDYASLDLTSPDAVMDAVGNTVGDVANQLLAGLGTALGVVSQLIGLDAPAGIPAVTLPALMADPLGAVSGYWQALVASPPATATVLEALRTALVDASQVAGAVRGSGSAADPWRFSLIGPLAFELSAADSVLTAGLAVVTSVDTLGQRCTVVETRFAATLARVDLAARSATLMPGVEATLTARERGADPRRARLELGNGVTLTAEHVGLRLGWSPERGLTAGVSAPSLVLDANGVVSPIPLPVVGANGSVALPPEAWGGVEALAGHLGTVVGGFVGQVVRVLGWTPPSADVPLLPETRLRIADVLSSPDATLGRFLPDLLLSHRSLDFLTLVSDLFAGSGDVSGVLAGRGTPNDPYRFALDAGLPNIAVWFPPQGLTPGLATGAAVLHGWAPGESGLSAEALEAGLRAEAAVASDVAALIEARALEPGLNALAQRWVGGDGRIAPPNVAPAGVTIRRSGVAAPQLLGELDLARSLGRTPAVAVFVALGPDAFADAPAARRVDLSTAGLDANMFTLPAAATGEWFVALGTRAACRAANGSTDGTPEQAARLARLLRHLSHASADLVLVAVAGAGHAARVAAEAESVVKDLVLLGTPLSEISLTALSTQPTADALRLLSRLLPARGAALEDEDLALGRGLVESMTALIPLPDPGADVRLPAVPPPLPRPGLNVVAHFGEVSDSQVTRAMTAVVAAGLRARAGVRAPAALEPPGSVHAGLRWELQADSSGALRVSGSAVLQLFSYDLGGGANASRVLQVRVHVSDRAGWLTSTPELELRAVSVELALPLDGAAPGHAKVTLHDARAFGQTWEALALGNVAGAVPVLPEARVLLASAVQRLRADATGAASVAVSQALAAMGLTDASGGVVSAALDRLVHDPGGLVRERLASAGHELAAALAPLLGAAGASVDFTSRTVNVRGGGAGAGRFGWSADVSASPSGIDGQLRFGPDSALPTVGGLELTVDLHPIALGLDWHQSGGSTESIPIWPAPDAAAIARVLAKAAPSLGAHVGIELMRRADESARPIIDAVLDALGLLAAASGDAERTLRPLAGFLGDPAGWLRSEGSLAASPLALQALFDALRPLLGVPGAPGSALALAPGVELSSAASGSGVRLALLVDPSAWTPPSGATGRLAGAVGASLAIGRSGPPEVALDLQLGLPGVESGRQAIHARLGSAGIEVFLRPASGADIPLVPFAGFGVLAAVAEAALPFLLDQLAELAGTPGDLVRTLGDALALRQGTPAKFDAAALRAWAADPVAALSAAVPSITATGLTTLAPLLDDFLPASVSATATVNELSVSVAGVTLAWSPASGRVSLAAPNVAVPGIEALGLRLTVSDAGLDELSVALGPARIDAGGVLLRPFASISAGVAPLAGRRVSVGLSADDTHHFAARWSLDSGSFDLVASDGALATAADSTDPGEVALRIVEVVADLVAAVAMAEQPVKDLLDTPVNGKNVRFLLQGVLLEDVPNPNALISELFVPERWLARAHRLFLNIANVPVSIPVGNLTFGLRALAGTVGLEVGVVDRFELVKGDVMLWLENDASWIAPSPGGGGLFVGFLSESSLSFQPSLVVNGLGLRIGKSSGPLLDIGLTLESVAVHVFAAIDASGVDGAGVELQFSNLAVSASGAQGDNGIAQGVMRDTGPTPPKPAFSPALAVQKHGDGPFAVSLRAGDGDGPWWIAIQKGFGPLYLEQIGFGTTTPQGRLERISLLMDGSVSLFGLTCAVDDLQITYIASNNDFFNPASWAVDLAGLAVSADMAGVTLAGGLLKQTTPQGIEYLGMLLGRFGVYGLTVYGGYGEGDDNGQKFTAFFAIGAVNGPIGGPPAFFLTGIGGGFGINRRLVVPTDLSNFGDYPLIQALDIAATPSDPMTQLRALGQYFPMQKGTFWFAAGLSFNSFALVDGIAVLGVQIGDGLDISLLGLARMALPRPQVALVSIEIALLVRFSSSEGVLWIQGQLTDNSWLLYPDIKLTGGFAYVIWFKGQNKGHFVLTLGGYHPSFHRDGYPEVPRLGMRWSIGSNIVIKSGSYFALTSEALMAGGDFEASASFGPAWAEVKFGADGIVYFDPFSYDVSAYARIAAGITIDTWIFGEITISISLGARIHVLGPDFRGSVTFEVGPVELTFEFGGSDKALREPLGESEFITKYLEAAESGRARAHAVMTNTGALPAKGEKSTPDGSSSRPFIVVAEFSLTFTSSVPATVVNRTHAGVTTHAPSHALGVAPRNVSNANSEITLSWVGGAIPSYPFTDTARPFGRFPAGVWGGPQDPQNRKVPTADMIEALSELDLVCRATPSPPGPEVPYYQVEIGQRRPLPFTRRISEIAELAAAARAVTSLVVQPATTAAAFAEARRFLVATATPTALAGLVGERQAPPRLGTLTEGLEFAIRTEVPAVAERPAPKQYDHFVDAPVVVGLLPGTAVGLSVAPKARTSVKGSERAWRVSPPTFAGVEAERSRSIAARLVLNETPASTNARKNTVIAAQTAPPTGRAAAPAAIVRRTGSALPAPLADFEAALVLAGGKRRRGVAAKPARGGALLAAGHTVVLKLPNARSDASDAERPELLVNGAPARVVMLASGGRRTSDSIVGPQQASSSVVVPRGTERVVVVALGVSTTLRSPPPASRVGLAGWHAGMPLPYAGWGTAVGPGCVVHAVGDRLAAHRERLDSGWVDGAELARGTSTVSTTFAVAPRTVVIVVDDPTAAGDPASARQLLLGLSGATRALNALGEERSPLLLTMENRSFLAYDIVPDPTGPVVVTIASQTGWSLVGVMGSRDVDAKGALALLSARGLDAAIEPLIPASIGERSAASRIVWTGARRTPNERALAKAAARGGLAVAKFERRTAREQKAVAATRKTKGRT